LECVEKEAKKYVEFTIKQQQQQMELDQMAENIVHKHTYMVIVTYLLKQIFIYRESDERLRIEYEDGKRVYTSDLSKFIDIEDVVRVTMRFPKLNEEVQIFAYK
jgi:hypothetical protein